ncbi:MAG: hypothetical protein OSA43_06005 [Pirellulales bacterium]|nr:hypothetical protein [Pirellulales bacterium]
MNTDKPKYDPRGPRPIVATSSSMHERRVNTVADMIERLIEPLWRPMDSDSHADILADIKLTLPRINNMITRWNVTAEEVYANMPKLFPELSGAAQRFPTIFKNFLGINTAVYDDEKAETDSALHVYIISKGSREFRSSNRTFTTERGVATTEAQIYRYEVDTIWAGDCKEKARSYLSMVRRRDQNDSYVRWEMEMSVLRRDLDDVYQYDKSKVVNDALKKLTFAEKKALGLNG